MSPEVPRLLHRLVARSRSLIPWGVMVPSLPLGEALEWVALWRQLRRADDDFDPTHVAVVQYDYLPEDGAAGSALRRFRDLIPYCWFTGDDRAIDGLGRLSRAFPELQIIAADRLALEHRSALVFASTEVAVMDHTRLGKLLDELDGRPLILLDRPAAPVLDLLRNTIQDRHVVVVPEADPVPVPLLFLQASAPGKPGLALDGERTAIEISLGEACMVHRTADLRAVGHVLSLHRPRVLHFGGHGDDGFLWFEGRNGMAHRETGARLAAEIAASLGTEAYPELIVLNACESDAFIEDLLPVCSAMVCMERPISDRAAVAFSGAFYRTLRPHEPGVSLRLEQAIRDANAEMGTADLSAAGAARWVEGKAGAMHGGTAAETKRGADDSVVTVWFGTERRPVDPTDFTRGFSTVQDDRLHTGSLKVRVARGPFGEISGGLFRERRVRAMLPTLRTFGALDAFTADLSAGMAEWRKLNPHHPANAAPELLVFVHGYNVGFEESARRAAQLHVDLQVPGVTAFYSWASADRLFGYWADEKSVERALPHLGDFLENLLAHSGAARFHLLAHSMGHRALLQALQTIAGKAGERTGKAFGQIFLCAPDVASADFRRAAACLPALSERTTLYISRRDRALWLSRVLHENDRAGYYPEITCVPGIDTIATEEVSGALLGLGHGYYAGTDALLMDIGGLLRRDAPPAARQRLHLEPDPHQPTHFVFGK